MLLGEVGKGYMGHSCTIFAASCESIIISKLKVKKIEIVTLWKMVEAGAPRIGPSSETTSKLAKKWQNPLL